MYFLIMRSKQYHTHIDDKVIMTILDEGPSQSQKIQTQNEEKNLKAIYLERKINWIEIEKEKQTLGFLLTAELNVNFVNFTDTIGDGSGDELIVITLINIGTMNLKITQVNFNGIKQIDNWKLTSGEDGIIECGAQETIQITGDWTAGNKYSITLSATDGTLVGYFTCAA